MKRIARAARQGDETKGICTGGCHHCPHTHVGVISSSSRNVFINGIGAAHVGCNEDKRCFHMGTGRLIDGSGSVFINGGGAARVKDGSRCMNCGQESTIINGSANVFIGD